MYDIKRYIRFLRNEEKYTFQYPNKLLCFWYRGRKNRLGSRLGFIISAGCFVEDLHINHFGSFIVDNVDIGQNAQILGGIRIADNVRIGAGAVVVKDVLTPGVMVVGVLGREIPIRRTNQ